ncbi:hypothetical protein GLOIN_2v1591923 [Rhizophagus clarus]|uniref:MI domain-containing protein n=1 Tax=Rhizophagus clarus TaxID=94130 RepID=A0A8H3L3B7_9GLOM|nr:hypothetical protein GLOIN_2v1591923 [Rhizophagus clarus]
MAVQLMNRSYLFIDHYKKILHSYTLIHLLHFFKSLSDCAMNVHSESGRETFDYKKQVNIQTQLIYSLRVRIEELETDSIIKNQNITKLQREIFDLKKNIQTIYDNINNLSGNLLVPSITPSVLQPPVESSTQKIALISEEFEIRKINNLMEEYFSFLNVEDAIISLKDIRSEYHAKAIEFFANKAIEQNQKDVDDVMKLFKNIISSKICNKDIFKNGFEGTIDFLMDIGADKPLAYPFTGQLLFSARLDSQDITKLLKPLDDDKLVERIIRGYASALKNDVDERTYIQKLTEFNFQSLFSMRNETDLNKLLQNLGLRSFFSHGKNDNMGENYYYDRNENKNYNYNYNNKNNESETWRYNYDSHINKDMIKKDMIKDYSYSHNKNPYPDSYDGNENSGNLYPTSYEKEGFYNGNPYPDTYNEDKEKGPYGENPYPDPPDPCNEDEIKDIYSGISYSDGNQPSRNPEDKSRDSHIDSCNKNRPYGGNPFPDSYYKNESKDPYVGDMYPDPYDGDENKDSYNKNLYSYENKSKDPYPENHSYSRNDKNSYPNTYNENKYHYDRDPLYENERRGSYNKTSYSDFYSKNKNENFNDENHFYDKNELKGSYGYNGNRRQTDSYGENLNKNYSDFYDEMASKDSHDGNSYNSTRESNNKNPCSDEISRNSYSNSRNENNSNYGDIYNESRNKGSYNEDSYFNSYNENTNNYNNSYSENKRDFYNGNSYSNSYNMNKNNYNNSYDENKSQGSWNGGNSYNSYNRNKNNYNASSHSNTYREDKSKNPYNRNFYDENGSESSYSRKSHYTKNNNNNRYSYDKGSEYNNRNNNNYNNNNSDEW